MGGLAEGVDFVFECFCVVDGEAIEVGVGEDCVESSAAEAEEGFPGN